MVHAERTTHQTSLPDHIWTVFIKKWSPELLKAGWSGKYTNSLNRLGPRARKKSPRHFQYRSLQIISVGWYSAFISIMVLGWRHWQPPTKPRSDVITIYKLSFYRPTHQHRMGLGISVSCHGASLLITYGTLSSINLKSLGCCSDFPGSRHHLHGIGQFDWYFSGCNFIFISFNETAIFHSYFYWGDIGWQIL